MNLRAVAAASLLSVLAAGAQATVITNNNGCGGSQTTTQCTTTWSDSWSGSLYLSSTGNTKSWSHTFDISGKGFVVGEDTINNYSLTLGLADDQTTTTSSQWSWTLWKYVTTTTTTDDSASEYAKLVQPGDTEQWEVNLGTYGFDGTIQGISQLNSSGQLTVTLYATSGDFYLNSASLAACGVDNTTTVPTIPPTRVPEPASLGLLGLGLLGIGILRKKQYKA
jgi:hypothetical protein